MDIYHYIGYDSSSGQPSLTRAIKKKILWGPRVSFFMFLKLMRYNTMLKIIVFFP